MVEIKGIERTKEVNINTPEYWDTLWGGHGGGERNDLERFMPIANLAILLQPALDVGCGFGHLCNHLNEWGCYPVYGVDFSCEAIERAKINYPHCHFEVAAAEKLPFDDETFMTVTIAEALEHLDDYLAALEEALRVTKKGGRIIFTVPDQSVYTEHVWTFTFEGVKDLVTALNYKNAEVSGGGAKRIAGKWLLGWVEK